MPAEGSVYLLNKPPQLRLKVWKTVLCKSRKDTRKQFLSFNSASVVLRTNAFFFEVGIIKKKIFYFLGVPDTQGRNGENKSRMHSLIHPDGGIKQLSIAAPAPTCSPHTETGSGSSVVFMLLQTGVTENLDPTY